LTSPTRAARRSPHGPRTFDPERLIVFWEHGLDAGEDGWEIVDFTMPRDQIIALLRERQAAGTLKGKIKQVF
jgi:hypothetical protein